MATLLGTFKRYAKGATAAAALAAAVTLAPSAEAQDRTGWPSSIKVGTASQGGTYFVYGAGWAGLVQEKLGVAATTEVTGGPVANMALIHKGDLDFGMVTMGPAFDGWVGKLELAPGAELKNVRALFPMYPTPFQVIALKSSGVSSVSGLDGKRVNLGPRTGTAATYWSKFFDTLGLKPNVQYGGAADASGQLQDGLIDAFAFAAGIPISAFSQVEAQNPSTIFGFTDAEMEKLLAEYPSVTKFTIPEGTYRAQTGPIQTVSMANFAVANKDMPESFVYEIMKVVLDNPERMLQVHAAAKDTKAENWDQNGFLWFHPGAVKYYKEKGIEIPEKLIPPEMK
ncbi:MAG: TAXI family TRAP transporter solute-binding subunit [Rhodospirillaceae bacterium]